MLTIKLIVAVSDFQTVFHKAGRQRSPKLPGRLLNMLVLDINSGLILEILTQQVWDGVHILRTTLLGGGWIAVDLSTLPSVLLQ